jgi:2,2-dialkylglycine decarboxylase (pyruvate)
VDEECLYVGGRRFSKTGAEFQFPEEIETMELWQTNPFEDIILDHGQGCRVWDTSGQSYLDLLSGTWCNVLGYSHPRWIAAIREQVAKLTHTGAAFISPEIHDALTGLAQILSPALNRVVFLNTGSEAVELALKMACAAAHTQDIVVTERAYYGATGYALALSEAGRKAGYLPSGGTIYRLPVPDCPRCPMGCTWPCGEEFPCLEPLARLAEKGDNPIAAVLYEPVLAGAGIRVPPPGYGACLRSLTTRCNALLIAEEVTTGMGRTGRWFGFQHDDMEPDILVIGKAIGAGLPIAAVVSNAEVERRSREMLGRHVQSHQNDPFSGRIAAAVISILQEENLVQRAAERGDYLLAGLKELQLATQGIREVRGRGAMVGIELEQELADRGAGKAQQLLEAGFIVNWHAATGSFRLFPPYIISTPEIDSFLQAFGEALTKTI